MQYHRKKENIKKKDKKTLEAGGKTVKDKRRLSKLGKEKEGKKQNMKGKKLSDIRREKFVFFFY